MTTLQTVLLFASGYLVSRLLLRAQVHEHFVAWLLLRARGRVSRVVLGLMAGACALSLMAPNALVVLAMIPVVTRLRDEAGQSAPSSYATLLTMGLVYGSNIGGIGSLLGSPANLYLLINLRVYGVAGREAVHFVSWLAFGLPLALLLLLTCWLVLWLIERRAMSTIVPSELVCARHALHGLALRLALLFVAFWGLFIVLTLVARLGGTSLLALEVAGYPIGLSWADAAALLATSALVARLFWPGGAGADVSEPSRPAALLALRDLWRGVPLKGIAFGLAVLVILVLVAKSGLVAYLSRVLPKVMPAGVGALATALGLSIVTIFATEVVSNTTAATVMFPLALVLASRVGGDPVALMVGVSLASTCAFMTPVATPVNALAIAGVGDVSLRAFLRAGAAANVLCGVLIGLWMVGPLRWILG